MARQSRNWPIRSPPASSAVVNIALSLGLFSLYRIAAGPVGILAICFVWSRSPGRFVSMGLLFALLFGVLFLAPLAVILLSSLADQWNGVLPSGLTTEHYSPRSFRAPPARRSVGPA